MVLTICRLDRAGWIMQVGSCRFGSRGLDGAALFGRYRCGEVPEWPKGTGCKPVGSAFGGSNPPLSTICGSSSVVERQPSKLRVAGSNPVSRSIRWKTPANASSSICTVSGLGSSLCGSSVCMACNAHVAQSAEHILGKDEVTGSIPVMGSNIMLTY